MCPDVKLRNTAGVRPALPRSGPQGAETLPISGLSVKAENWVSETAEQPAEVKRHRVARGRLPLTTSRMTSAVFPLGSWVELIRFRVRHPKTETLRSRLGFLVLKSTGAAALAVLM